MAIKNWEPAAPRIRYEQRGKILITTMQVNVAPGIVMAFRSAVDLAQIERDLRAGKYDEVSGIFGSIFKGIKKAVKAVGKATGLDKVVKVAGKVLNNPIIKSVVPGAALAAGGIKAVSSIVKARGSAKKGKKKKARAYLRKARKDLKRFKKRGKSRKKQIAKGAKVYELIVNPK